MGLQCYFFFGFAFHVSDLSSHISQSKPRERKERLHLSHLLLLLLSRFSCVRLCASPQMAAHQAPPSLGFSRQEHWSGLPLPSPMMKVKSESEVAQSCPTLSDPMDCSPPGSSVHGIFQARVLEWGAIAFSDGLHCPWNSPGQNTGVGSLSLLQEIFPTQGLNPDLSHCRQILYQLSHKGSPQ